MPIQGSWNTIKAFFLTQVHLEEPDGKNTFANESLWYVQYFFGRETIEQKADKFYLVQKPEIAEKASWIPSSLKTAAYFVSALIWIIPGTLARLGSFDSEDVTDAVFADRITQSPPQAREVPRPRPTSPPPSTPAQIAPPPAIIASAPTSEVQLTVPAASPNFSPKLKQADLSEAQKVKADPSYKASSPSPNSSKGLWGSIVDNVKSAAKAAGQAAAAPVKALESVGEEAIKPMMQASMIEMLQKQMSFTEELIRVFRSGPDRPNYSAVKAFINIYTEYGETPFYHRDLFVGMLSVSRGLGIELDPTVFTRWEELDIQCQIIMHSKKLELFLNEKPKEEKSDWQKILRHTIDNDKEKMVESSQKVFNFLQHLEVELKKNPLNRSTILSILNTPEEDCTQGAIVFHVARFNQALNRFVKNWVSKDYLQLYISCLSQLQAAKISIPSLTNPIAIDLSLVIQKKPPTPSPAVSSSQTSEKMGRDDLPAMCKYLITFEEMILQKATPANIKPFIETLRTDRKKYDSPFFIRNYFCYMISDPKSRCLVNSEDFARWEEIDLKFQMIMYHSELRGYLDEEIPTYWEEKGIGLQAILYSALQSRKEEMQQEIEQDWAFFKKLFAQLLSQKIDREALEQSLVKPNTVKIFSRAREYAALRYFVKGILPQKQYDDYCSSYIACMTKLVQLQFKIPYAKYQDENSSASLTQPPAQVTESSPQKIQQ